MNESATMQAAAAATTGTAPAAPRWTAVGLTEGEYQLVLNVLGREPNDTELQLYGVMWSEHCSYKHSRPLLKNLPTQGPRVLQGPGENAGVLDLGDGLAVAFKIESHNHPSAVEPYQGAATGVGGIIRDVFTMGARPIAMLDSLRFGELTGPAAARNAYLLGGVVGGIGGYGNSIGIPTVGGEIYFEPAYQGNPLVNAMCVGVVDPAKIQRGIAKGPGNPVMYIGASTGRDGIHGASLLASQSFDEQAEEKRPSVQVGDPFHEKLLLEACLELFETGAIVAMQDMGAAGLISSSSEVAARGGVGLDIDIDRVPRREAGMAAWEVLLSESQERMLAIVEKGREEDVLRVVRHWGLQAAVIGRVTEGHDLVIREGGQVAARMPVESLTDAPVCRVPASRPADLTARQSLDPSSLPEPTDLNETLLRLLASPNLASRAWVYKQYDYTVRSNTIVYPGSDAAVLRLQGTPKALALATDCNGRYCYLNPRLGAALAVAEAARNVSVAGGEPIGITNCLNFGDPDQPEVFWTFEEAIAGMAGACTALATPVTGGNVSFYNQTGHEAIYPTPVIGMVGLLNDAARRTTLGLKRPGDLLVLVGPLTGREVPAAQQGEGDPLGIGGSEYLKQIHGQVAGQPPVLSLSLERAVQQAVLRAVGEGLVQAAHDCADGGLAIALCEMWLGGDPGTGVTVDLAAGGAGTTAVANVGGAAENVRPDFLLFGETASRVLLEVDPASLARLQAICSEAGVPLRVIGGVAAAPQLRIGLGSRELISLGREAAEEPWKEALAWAISQ